MKGFIGILAVAYLFHHADAAVTGWTGAVTSATATATGTYATAISESAAIGTSLFNVTATSGLASPTWTYALTSGATVGQIAATGVVTSKAALDFETAATVTFVITADDGSGTLGTATVTLKVADEPALEYSAYVFCLPDKTVGGTGVTASSSTAGVTYTLGGTDAGSFDISSGTISLKSTVTLAYSTKPFYTATIIGTSGSETSATPLMLYVCTGCSSTSAAVGLSIYMSVFVLAAASTKLI